MSQEARTMLSRLSRILHRPPNEISAEEVIRELTRDRGDGEDPVYRVSGKRVSGKLNLKHRTVKVAIEMQSCQFSDEVDLRYSEFEQAVDFSGCTFYNDFNSGDISKPHTIYR